jgi:hypothetical protein
MYGLSNSFGKFLLVGLENTGSSSCEFEPMIRLSSRSFSTFRISLDCWEAFKQHFGEIENFFTVYDEKPLMDKQMSIPGYIIRFMTSYSDRAVELAEDRYELVDGADGLPPTKKKKLTASLVFKRCTFERLKDLLNCIDSRIKYLMSVKKSMEIIIPELYKFAKNELKSDKNSQITYFTTLNAKYGLRKTNDEFVDNIHNMLKQNNLNLVVEDLHIVISELVHIHTDTLTCILNKHVINEMG